MLKRIEPVLSAEARVYYWDRALEFVQDQIVWPARANLPSMEIAPDQRSVLEEVPRTDKAGIESGHGTGKSALFAWLAIWFLSTRMNYLGHNVRVPCMAPTHHQLRDVLWPEIKRWVALSRLHGILEANEHEIWVRGLKDSAFGVARSVKNAMYLAGFHAPHMLWLVDEAFGIADDLIWETVEGSCTDPGGDNRIVFGGQHATITGYCHDAFTKDKASWKLFRFNSENSPIASRAYCERIAKKYGRNSDVYRVRVLGQAPAGNPQSWIQLAEAEQARQRETTVLPSDVIEIGVDCARFGDDSTVVTVRCGNRVWPQSIEGKTDTDRQVAMVIQALRRVRKTLGNQRLATVKIDESGGFGVGLIDALRKNETDNLVVVGVNFGGAGDTEYHDAVSVMMGELKEALQTMQLPDDDYLVEEICTRRYSLDKDERIWIESKADFKKEYGSSPDRLDSLLLAVTKKAVQRYVMVGGGIIPAKKFAINWEKQSELALHYGALYLNEEGRVWFLAALWDAVGGALFVYDAHQYHALAVDAIGSDLVMRLQLRKYQLTKLLGSERFFARGVERTVAEQLSASLRMFGGQVGVLPAVRYEELGAISFGNTLLWRGQAIVHERIRAVAVELANWRYEEGVPEKGKGYCQAFLLIASELRKQVPEVPLPPKRRDYRTRQMKPEPEYSWMAG